MLSDRDPSSQGFLVPSLVPSDSFGFGFSHYSDPVGSDFLVGSYRPQLIASSSATHVCSPLLSRSLASISSVLSSSSLEATLHVPTWPYMDAVMARA